MTQFSPADTIQSAISNSEFSNGTSTPITSLTGTEQIATSLGGGGVISSKQR